MRKIVCVGAALAVVLAAAPMLSVARAEAPKGKLSVTAGEWTASLTPTPRGKAIRLKGGTEAVDVPAGTYRVQYSVTASPGEGLKPARVTGTAGKVVIKAGETTELKVGPLEAQVQASVKGGKMRIGLSFKDAGGNKAMLYASPGKAKSPAPPKIDVADASGKTIYTAALSFG